MTAVSGLEDMVRVHLLDALLALPSLTNRLKLCEQRRVLDVGSGNGVPALIWALLSSNIRISLVEKSSKKASFLQYACGILNLRNRVTILNRDIKDKKNIGIFDIITSRAFSDCINFLKITTDSAHEESAWLLFTTKKRITEWDANILKADRFMIGEVLDFSSFCSKDRALVWLNKF